jgi:hypothetical protein
VCPAEPRDHRDRAGIQLGRFFLPQLTHSIDVVVLRLSCLT